MLALFLERAEQFETAHPRHHQIGEDDRRTKDADFLQRFVAIPGGFDAESPALDQLLHPHTRGGIVLDDEHTFVQLVAYLFA